MLALVADCVDMNCPNCHSEKIRRSRRKSALDHFVGMGGAVPWRCSECSTRFYARSLPLRHSWYAHCSICGNLDLQVISAEYVSSPLSFVGRLLHFPAWRCEPCRHKFFTIRPRMKEEERLARTEADPRGAKYQDSSH